MKIYNKRGFFTGLFWLILGGCKTYLMVYKGMNLTDAFFCILLLVIAVIYLSRSFSKNASEKDQDELTVHLLNRSRSLAFFWSKIFCVACLIFWLLLYSHTKNELHFAAFMGAFVMLMGMLVIELVTEIYCDHKME